MGQEQACRAQYWYDEEEEKAAEAKGALLRPSSRGDEAGTFLHKTGTANHS